MSHEKKKKYIYIYIFNKKNKIQEIVTKEDKRRQK